jgi:hypothetical protein
MAIRISFASRGSERREWRRSGLTRTSTTLPMVYLSLVLMPRAKASVRTIPAWGERKVVRGAAGRATPVRPVRAPVRPVQAWTGRSSGFVLVQVRGLVLEVVVLVVGLESLQELSLLGVLPLVLNMGMGGVVALRWRGGTVPGTPFVVLVLLQVERVGSLKVVTVVVFVEVALVGRWFGLFQPHF